MKKQLLFIAVLMAASFCHNAQAQVSVHVNLGVQPVWGPTGYDYVNYYYIPDIDAYYDVPNQRYTYFEGGQWVTRGSLPERYHDFDLYGAHKVVINERSPWMHNDRYKSQYAGFRGQHDQHPIRDSRDERYYANPNHPHHNEWHGDNGHQNHGNNAHERHGDNGHQNHGNNGHEQHGDNGHQNHGNNGHEQHGNNGHEEHGHEEHGHEEHR